MDSIEIADLLGIGGYTSNSLERAKISKANPVQNLMGSMGKNIKII